MRLLRVELTRLRWRRAVLLLVVAAVAIPAFILGAVAWETRPVTPADVAAAEETAAREQDQPYIQDELDRCLEDPESYLGPAAAADPQAACDDAVLPRAEWFLYRQPLDVEQQLQDTGSAVPVLLFVLLLLVGATFVGADWTSGSMSNQLLFEPRRTRVWAAKAGALAALAAAVAAGVQGAFWFGMTTLARVRDLPVPDEVWDRLPGLVGRGTLLVVAATLLGYSLTMLFRSTVATLGIVFAVAVAGTFVIAVLPLGGDNERWMVQTNLLAFVQNGTDYYNSQVQVTCTGAECDGMSRLSLAGATAYLGTILVAAAALGLATFRRRDVP